MISTSPNILLFRSSFILESKKVSRYKVGRICRLLPLWDTVLGQQILHKLRRTQCYAVVVDLPVAWRPLYRSLAAYCVAETRQNL
jgi:hypothetical protein